MKVHLRMGQKKQAASSLLTPKSLWQYYSSYSLQEPLSAIPWSIAVVYKNVNKKMRTTINLFVANIAASDLLTTVLSVPTLYWTVVASTYLSNPDESAEYFDLCKVSSLVWLFSSGNSLLSLVAISFDRFLAVFIPTKQPLTRKKTPALFL